MFVKKVDDVYKHDGIPIILVVYIHKKKKNKTETITPAVSGVMMAHCSQGHTFAGIQTIVRNVFIGVARAT